MREADQMAGRKMFRLVTDERPETFAQLERTLVNQFGQGLVGRDPTDIKRSLIMRSVRN